MLLSVTLGYVLGALSGYLGGVADRLIMRFANLLMTIPGLPLLIIMGAMLTELDVSPDYRIYMVMIMLSLLGWPSLARLVRGQILSLRERDFMLATEVLGLSTGGASSAICCPIPCRFWWWSPPWRWPTPSSASRR